MTAGEEVVEAVARAIERADNETGYEYDHLHIECSDWGIHLARAAIAAMPSIPQGEPEPVPMILTCPSCGERHYDEGEFATKPHHTHACQGCGVVWRPAKIDTVGVRFLPGYKNEEPSIPQESDAEVTEAIRDEIVAAYEQGALDVHNAWIESLGEENAPSRDPDFTEAAHDYASAQDREQPK
jgi:hypothetical protein